ncbi:hypothetical protein MNBD_ALPHA09-432 [hydrothermal vent metagenome]|uniref:O-antigen ligase-related domain-containing protein n=1 Tax=hydrothermal vent metagenome TaxID=652676 RepID=A0A3B0TKT3_9ZZZZ
MPNLEYVSSDLKDKGFGSKSTGAVGGPFVFLCLILIWSPLPLASNRPAIWGANAILVAVLLIWTTLWGNSRPRAGGVPLGRIWFPATAFFAVAGWLALQALPFAPAVLIHPAWDEAARVLGAPIAGSISVTPADTLIMLLRFLTYGAFFWCALQLTRSWRRALLLVYVFFAMTIVYAIYGLVLDAIQSTTILWYEKWTYLDVVTATFVNRNAFAAFAGSGCIAGIALLFRRMRNARSRFPEDRIKTFIMMSSEFISTSGLIIAGVLVLFVALVLTGSRAGLISTMLGLGVFVIFGAGRRAGGVMAVVSGLAVVVVLATALALSGDLVAGRFLSTAENWETRRLLFEGTINAINDRPLLGYGGGSFIDVFGLYMPDAIGSQFQFRRAHNTYLELALELGVPMATLLIGGFLALGVRLFIGVRRRRDRYWLPALALSVGFLFAVHSLVDFPLQMQANTFVFLALLAAGVAQSWRRDELADKRTRAKIPNSISA